jgi:ATP-dependent DNA helicase RecQ
MIDESPAGEEFKRGQRGKLDALLALAEAHDCRRLRLLAYFGEASVPCQPYQHACDNCQSPPAVWDATEASRKLLSCIYRFTQHRDGPRSFGAGHLIDVLRGKVTDKVTQFGHERLSTFGLGADLGETQWRGVLRQLIALGHVVSVGEYNTLALTDSARAVLKGEVALLLRVPSAAPPRKGSGRYTATGGASGKTAKAAQGAPADLDDAARVRFEALRAWRTEVAREHNLPSYIVFSNAALADMARRAPTTLAELGEISGVGEKKLDAYGRDILRALKAI